ncbi:5-(carboxyamino)imidazole ribonucleotide synthase [Candidatus Uhrbacteria bacterium]|nr:5-(carboxyamino)imidazole ribonucleotide synthase [Candidatus Uhrbacteria bacterium]
MATNSPVLPGSTIGILGGGQLGCMLAMAARTLGYRIAALDPNNHAPIKALSDHFICAPFNDPDAAAHVAKLSKVVTIEIEHISAEALYAVEKHAPLQPRSDIVVMVHDRYRQKSWLEAHHFPIARWKTIEAPDDMRYEGGLPLPGILKTTRGGYDGRGQRPANSKLEVTQAFEHFGQKRCVLEEKLQIASEVSVMVVRKDDASPVAYPTVFNMHKNGILAWTTLPRAGDNRHGSRPQEIALAIAEKLDFVGVLTVEFFETTDGKLYVNELAPRIHNSYHASLQGCATSHAEQAVRAICGLPLGSPQIVRPAAMFNLLGDLWKDGDPPFEQALVHPNVSLHLYGKGEPRPGRKMGHFTVTASSPDEALRAGQEVYRHLARH